MASAQKLAHGVLDQELVVSGILGPGHVAEKELQPRDQGRQLWVRRRQFD